LRPPGWWTIILSIVYFEAEELSGGGVVGRRGREREFRVMHSLTIPGVVRYGIVFNAVLGLVVFSYWYAENLEVRQRILESNEDGARRICNGSVAIRSIWFSGMLKKGETWVSNLPKYFRER